MIASILFALSFGFLASTWVEAVRMAAAAANPVSIVFILIVNACFEYELKS